MSALHRDAAVVDCHNDLLGLVHRRPRGEQGEYFRSHWLPQLRNGGVDIQVMPVFSATDNLQEVVSQLEAGHRIAEANHSSVTLCLTGADIDEALAEAKIALVLAVEGCGSFGSDAGMVEAMFRLGVRMISFTHWGRSGYADGSGEDATGSRLTSAGVEAMEIMEELGILMDVSHLSAGGVEDVLERASRPVLASHSSAHALNAHHRNLTDERLRGIAATGGVIGVNCVAPFIDPANASVERVVDHIQHVGVIAGADHVGLGPDFIEDYAHEVMPDLLSVVIDELGGPLTLPRITEELVRRGTSEMDVRAILGENWLRLFRAELGVPATERA